MVVSRPVLQVLSSLFGVFGVDRFYVGQTSLGVLKLLTCGACGVWASVDAMIQIIEGISKSKTTRFGSSISIDESSIQSGFYLGLVLLAVAAVSFVVHHRRKIKKALGATGSSSEEDETTDAEDKGEVQPAESRAIDETSADSYSL